MHRRAIFVIALVAIVACLLMATRGGAVHPPDSRPPKDPTLLAAERSASVLKPVTPTPPGASGNRAQHPSDSAVLYSTLSTSDPEQAPAPPTDERSSDEQTPAPAEPPDARWARFQRDRDDFLLHTLAPRARDCWKKIEGEGRIEFLYLMRHESGQGVGRITPTTDIGVETPVSIVESELTSEQSKQALDCMLDAIEGTSFTSELPTPGETLVGMYQGWHVGKTLARE